MNKSERKLINEVFIHELIVIGFIFILAFAGWKVFQYQKQVEVKEAELLIKHEQMLKAESEMSKVLKEAEAIKRQNEELDKKFHSQNEEFKQILRIKKDLRRIVGPR